MKKQTPKTSMPRAQSAHHAPRRPERPPISQALMDAFEAALAEATQLAEPYPEETESIDNVIRFVRDHRHGQAAEVRLSDVLIALSILLCALDRDLTQEERDMLAVLERVLHIPTRAGVVRVPAAPHQPPPIVPCRRVVSASCRCAPGATTATSAPTHNVRFAA